MPHRFRVTATYHANDEEDVLDYIGDPESVESIVDEGEVPEPEDEDQDEEAPV